MSDEREPRPVLHGEIVEGPAVGPAGADATRTRTPTSAKDAVSSVTIVLVGIAVLVGLVMVVCTGGSAGPGQSGVGFGLLVFGLPVILVAVLVIVYRPAPRHRVVSAASGTLLLLVLAGALAASLASVAGLLVRWLDPVDYTGRYGTRVTATLPDVCTNKETDYGAAKGADPDIVCEHATWRRAGETRTGTVIIDFADVDLPTGFGVPDSVEAYVLGDRGYSVRRVGTVNRVAIWGAAPVWWLVGAPVAVLSVLALRWVGWVAEPATGASRLAASAGRRLSRRRPASRRAAPPPSRGSPHT
jgi:hypothetical protein